MTRTALLLLVSLACSRPARDPGTGPADPDPFASLRHAPAPRDGAVRPAWPDSSAFAPPPHPDTAMAVRPPAHPDTVMVVRPGPHPDSVMVLRVPRHPARISPPPPR